MARLFGDENFPLPVILELRRLGHDVVTLQETGHGGRALLDEVVLEAAQAARIDAAIQQQARLTGILLRVNRPDR